LNKMPTWFGLSIEMEFKIPTLKISLKQKSSLLRNSPGAENIF
jgi:hypothetical protein